MFWQGVVGGIIYLGRYVCTVSDVEKDREE